MLQLSLHRSTHVKSLGSRPGRTPVAPAVSLRLSCNAAPVRTLPSLPCRSSAVKGHAVQRCSVRAQAAAAAGDMQEGQSALEKFAEQLTVMFPIWVMLGAGIGIAKPSAVTWFSSDIFTYALGFLMLSMGLTLTFKDFKQCMDSPVPILVGYLAQYIIKPALGVLIAKTLNLAPPLAVGLILVSCCPGGQASNVATFIAHGNVALSVLMTTASTLGAIIMTPTLTKVLAGAYVPVDAYGLAMSTFQVVLVPTLVGVLVNEFAPGFVRSIRQFLPLLGVFLTTMLCASPVGQVADVLKVNGPSLATPVFLLHAAAFAMGYFLCKLLGFDEKTARTVSIETVVGLVWYGLDVQWWLFCGYGLQPSGNCHKSCSTSSSNSMQSAALGFMLAQQHFTDPLVCVPSAVSVVCMALGGAGLAVYWRGQPVKE